GPASPVVWGRDERQRTGTACTTPAVSTQRTGKIAAGAVRAVRLAAAALAGGVGRQPAQASDALAGWRVRIDRADAVVAHAAGSAAAARRGDRGAPGTRGHRLHEGSAEAVDAAPALLGFRRAPRPDRQGARGRRPEARASRH